MLHISTMTEGCFHLNITVLRTTCSKNIKGKHIPQNKNLETSQGPFSVENLVLIHGLFLDVPLPCDPHIFAAIRTYERNRCRPFALEPKRPNHVRAKCRQRQIIWQSYLTA